jgi:hypothetical protein
MNNKHIVEPYFMPKIYERQIKALKCDLIRRIAIRGNYEATLKLLQGTLNDKIRQKLIKWIDELNQEIWMSIKHGYRFPLFVEYK